MYGKTNANETGVKIKLSLKAQSEFAESKKLWIYILIGIGAITECPNVKTQSTDKCLVRANGLSDSVNMFKVFY